METAIRCRGVEKRFGAVQALRGLDLEVGPGLIYGYLGPNGAGKTTTIRILMGLLGASAGTTTVLGSDPRRAATRREVGYLPGEFRLDERVTVGEQLDHWSRLRGGVSRNQVRQLLERLDVDPTLRCRGLSSGTRRKVGLVGAFMGSPRLLVLDEPTNGLDPLMQQEFIRLAEEARAAGRTVFISSHMLSEVQRLADRVAVLRSGLVVMEGSVEELRRRLRQTITVEFALAAPAAELGELPGVRLVSVRGRRATLEVGPDLGPLLRLLAGHEVLELHAPEPDLEEVFLSAYEPQAAVGSGA